MPSIIHEMQNALELAGGNVGFTALFLAGLFALWNSKFNSHVETGNLFWYALAVLLVVISPVYQTLVQRFFPELMQDNMFLWILPTAPVILYVSVIAIRYGKSRWNQAMLIVGMISLLLLAALTSYTQSDRQAVENSYYIPEKEYLTITEIDNYRQEMHKDTIMIWGPDPIIQYSRIYSGRLYTLYGKDLWLGVEDSQLHQIYEAWNYDAYSWMQNEVDFLEQIGELAENMDCDVVVLSRKQFEDHEALMPDMLGEKFYLYYIGEEYFFYAK